MTWPNTTISTDNVDAGSDEPRLARAQIKETIDAVNQMISNGAELGLVITKPMLATHVDVLMSLCHTHAVIPLLARSLIMVK